MEMEVGFRSRSNKQALHNETNSSTSSKKELSLKSKVPASDDVTEEENTSLIGKKQVGTKRKEDSPLKRSNVEASFSLLKKQKKDSNQTISSNREFSSNETQQDTSFEKLCGKVKKIKLYNFMCHSHLEFIFDGRINFVSGKNGSGKSALLTALIVGLGGRSSDTNRGYSIKSFIKHGEHSCIIEITLNNEGGNSYNPDIYGNEITVQRKIFERGCCYRFLSEKGKIVSNKRDELTFILMRFNIQIHNPICILNQDMARNFLKSSKPDELYRLFYKGTLLEYVDIKIDKFQKQLLFYGSYLQKLQKDHEENNRDILNILREKKNIEKLKKKRYKLEKVIDEAHWSYVSALERGIKNEENTINDCQQSLKNLQERIGNHDQTVSEMQNSMKQLENQLILCKKEKLSIENEHLKNENNFIDFKEDLTRKLHEIEILKEKKKTAIVSRNKIQVLVVNQEERKKENVNKLNDTMKQKDDLIKKMYELKATLSTSELHKYQISEAIKEYNKSCRQKMRFLNNLNTNIKYKVQYLENLRKGSHELTIYAPWMHELVEEIKIIDHKQKFDELPRGPFGNYIKLVEEDWGPAIEYLLGSRILHSFCVHSKKDYLVLSELMDKLLIPRLQRPQVTISRFIHKVFDVTRNETRSANYSNLFRMLSISDPIVANSLIDQCQIERVLLIPTNKEVYPLLENINTVPPNCKKVLTKTGDTFYPQPNYRTYSGSVKEQARYLQISKDKIIKSTEIEVNKLKKEYDLKKRDLNLVESKINEAQKDMDGIEQEVAKLNKQLVNCEMELLQLNNVDLTVNFNSSILAADIKHWTDVIESCDSSIKDAEEIRSGLVEKVKALKLMKDGLEKQKNQNNEKSKEIESELSKIKTTFQESSYKDDTKLLNEEGVKCAEHIKKLKELQEQLIKAKIDANKRCPVRIDNPRPLEGLQAKRKKLENLVAALNKIVSEELILPEDDLRIESFQRTSITLQNLKEIIQSVQEILDKLPQQMKKITFLAARITDFVFQSILKERNFVGRLDIDHVNKRLNIIIKPDPRALSEPPISTLSGGERSFSMVAFIVALWENMNSPFYFLDEFDVYLDELNRKIVMDLLISIGRSRHQHQYVFLTPHSTIAEEDSDIINFFRLKNPRQE